MAIDTNFASNILCLEGGKTNGSSSFTDSSWRFPTVTKSGTPVYSNTQQKFSRTSLQFVGDGYLSVDANAIDIGTDDFTIDFWAYIPSGIADGTVLIAQGTSFTQFGHDVAFYVYFYSTGNALRLRFGTGPDNYVTLNFGNNTPFNQWTHFAGTRSAGVVRAFRGGALSESQSVALDVQSGANAITVGGYSAGAYFTGHLDQVRVTKGYARWLSAFTPSGEPDEAPPINTGSAALVAPAIALSAHTGGFGSLAIMMATLKTQGGGSSNLMAPSVQMWATGHDATGANAFAGEIPKVLLFANGGASAMLSMSALSLSASGTVSNVGVASIAIPGLNVSATGSVANSASAAIKMPSGFRLAGYSGSVCSVTLGDGLTVSASGTIGSSGYATLELPLFEVSGNGTQQNSGHANLILPSIKPSSSAHAWMFAPSVQLTAVGSAVVAVTYEAYALNLKHQDAESPDELTHYTNYPFDRIVRYQNSYFGMNSTGLYLLEGTTDFSEPAPTPVPWAFKTAMTDFELPNLKTVNWAYFGGRLGPAATISIHYGDTGEQNYAYTTPRGASAQNYRQPFGRGIKSRYYAFEAEGDGELSLDSLMFDIAKSARKV